MQTGIAGLALIKHFEGFRPAPYQDVAGKWTIGYGHLLRAGEHLASLTAAQAEQLLRRDLRQAEQAVARLIHARLNQQQFDALVSFTFNLGAGALQRSTLRAKLNRREYDEISAEFEKWIWAGGRKWPGLLRRRMAEADLYRS